MDRFGIPARFYFGNPLPSNATVRYLTGIVDAMLGGWEHEATLVALRLPGSPLEQTDMGDKFDFDVQTGLPDSGLARLRQYAPHSVELFDRLEKLTPWRGAMALPGE
jgi:hypothetical protein